MSFDNLLVQGAVFGLTEALEKSDPTIARKPLAYQANPCDLGNIQAVTAESIQKVHEIGIGNSIQFKNGDGLTSLQGKRVVTTGLAAGGALGTASTATAAALSFLNPVVPVAVALGTLCSAAASYYFNYNELDLNVPKEHSTAVDRVSKMAFQQITQEYNVENVIGQALLHGKVDALKNSKVIKSIYEKYHRLVVLLDYANDHASINKAGVLSVFAANVDPSARKLLERYKITANLNPSSSIFAYTKPLFLTGISERRVAEAQERIKEWADWKEYAVKVIDNLLAKDIEKINAEFERFLKSIDSKEAQQEAADLSFSVAQNLEDSVALSEAKEQSSGWNLVSDYENKKDK